MGKLYPVNGKEKKRKKKRKKIPRADCVSDHQLLIANSDLNLRKQGKPLYHSDMT